MRLKVFVTLLIFYYILSFVELLHIL